MISGQGSEPGFIVPVTMRNVMSPVARMRIQGNVPVQKKSKTLPPPALNPKASTLTHLKNPKMKKPTAPPTFNQSDVLNLLRSTFASSMNGLDPTRTVHLVKAPIVEYLRSRTVGSCPLRCSPCTTRPASSSSPRGLHDSGGGSSAAAVPPRRSPRPASRSPISPISPGVPAILDHRVVTLHPKIHGGLLADPTKPEHRADMAAYGIEPIDLRGVQPLPVRQRSEHRADRHRRPGDGACRGQEP